MPQKVQPRFDEVWGGDWVKIHEIHGKVIQKPIKSKSKCVFLLLLGQLCLFFVFATKSDVKHHKNKLENDPNGDIHFTLISLI